MQEDSAPLVDAYAAIESLLGEVDKYVNVSGCGLYYRCGLWVWSVFVGVATVSEPMGYGVWQYHIQTTGRHVSMAESVTGYKVREEGERGGGRGERGEERGKGESTRMLSVL